jgi:hypothetical protein
MMATEKRLIDANEVLEVICDYCPDDIPCPVGGCAEFQKIRRLLTADAVEVVRCKDCRFWHVDTVSCDFVGADTNWYAEDYCSYGERKDNDS